MEIGIFVQNIKEMNLTSERGREIREINSGIKEIEVCDEQGLVHRGGSGKKLDGVYGDNSLNGASIKNSSSSSTQVHLTTQKSFSDYFLLSESCRLFLYKFCGNESISNDGLDRYYPRQIQETSDFEKFLNDNKVEVVNYIIRGRKNELVEDVFWRNSKTNVTYKIRYEDIMEKIKDCKWVVLNGGIHLKNELGKTYFHFQREGKKKRSNRYNVLFHIHYNLFM